MPEYLAPGVYVEEVSTGPRPIEGVSTSTAGFVGETERGPQKPKLVTSWQDYARWFGSYVDRPPFGAGATGSPNLYLPYAVRGFFDNGGQRLFVARIVGNGSVTAAGQLPGGTVLRAIGPGSWGNNVVALARQASAAVGAAAGSRAASWFRIQVVYFRDRIPNPLFSAADPGKFGEDPESFEDFDNLTADPTQANYMRTVINGSSHLVQLDENTPPPTVPPTPPPPAPPPPPAQGVLAGGTTVDAQDPDYLDDQETDPREMKGLQGIGQIRDVSLVAIPDSAFRPGLADKLIDLCENRRDRFAVVSAQVNQNDFATFRPPRDSTYAAFYYPWIRVAAPHTQLGHLLIPPTGHATGIYARVDVERGVHKAPANEVVRGIITRDLLPDHKPLEFTLDKRQHDMLNPRGVNVIRDFRPDGRDIRMWGARTMTSDAMWKYINVRRLFIFVEQSIERGTQWAVFEPNSEPTWSAIKTSIRGFLRTVWRNGALAGTTAEEAFFVKCDRTTMTQDDLDNGRLICLIGIAPVKPAEFVIFRISQKTVEAES